MAEPRSFWQALLASLLIALLALPNTVYAQDFEFGDDDVEETEPEETGDEGGDSEEGLEFDSEDLSQETATQEETPQVAVVAIPTGDPGQTADLQNAMSNFAKGVPKIIVLGPETVLPAIEMRGTQECVVEPICLANAGEEGKVDRIIIGRVQKSDTGETSLVVDYFDVKERLFLRSSTQRDVGSVTDAVEPAMKDVLEIREKGTGPDTVGAEDSGIVQDVVAWGAGGLAIVALGLGIYFGTQATSKEEELGDFKQSDGTYSISQTEAEAILSDASDTATTSNIFYGLAAALAVTSAVFFIIRGGSDVAEDQERTDLIQDLQIAPIITEDTAGVGAGFRF